MSRSVRLAVLSAVALCAVPLSGTAANKFSWFDDAPPARDALGFPRSTLNPDARLAFGVDAYKSLTTGGPTEEDPYARRSDLVRVYGEFEPRVGSRRSPLAEVNRAAGEEPMLYDEASNRLSGFGLKWQHRVDSGSTVALSAGYNEFAWPALPSTQSIDMLDTRAALSWTGTFGGAMRPGITSSIFVGDESARDEAYQRLGRRYYGFSVGGQLTFQDHTPYLSYRLRRNFYSGADDPMYLLSPYDDHSLVSAGWKWQVQPNWSLQAEASYGLNGQAIDLYSAERDRSRFFFGTRFDFR